MSALRKRMQADMVLRGLAYRTQQTYIESVAKFAKFYGRSPDQITPPVPPRQPESVEAFWLRVAQLDIHQCAHCKTGCMVVIGTIPSAHARAPPLPASS